MTRDELELGPRVAEMRTVPEWLQWSILGAGMTILLATWQFEVGSPLIMIPVTLAGIIATALGVLRVPALCSILAIHENGLKMEVQGKTRGFRYDGLSEMTVKFTHLQSKGRYMFTRARIEFIVEGRYSPYVYQCEFRRDRPSSKRLAVGLAKCSEAIQRRLLAELERTGAVRWRDDVFLTADGIQLNDSATTSRLIPYHEIADWKIVEDELKIWKTGEGLPCLVMGNETPNFGPLMGLFGSLAKATRKIDPSYEVEPDLAVCV